MRAPMNKRWRGLLGALLATGTIAGFAAVAISPAAHAAFPGANGPVVFISSASNGAPSTLYKWTPGSGSVTTLVSGGVTDRPAVSADGSTVAYAGTDGTNTGIFLIPITDTPPSFGTFITGSGNCDDATFDPTGTFVVADCGGVLKRFATTSPFAAITLPTTGTSPAEPEVSPNGAQVAYVDTFSAEVFTISTAGTGTPQQITAPSCTGCPGPALFSEQVSWSPDGSKIALVDFFCSGGAEIAVVPSSGGPLVPTCLPQSNSGDTDPSWSPDGGTIVAGDSTGPPNNAVLIPASTSATGGRGTFALGVQFRDNFWGPTVTTTTTTTGATTTTTTAATTTTTG